MKARFLLCLSVLIACCAYQPVDSQLAFLNCPAKIASALLGECQKRLQERLDLVNTAEQEIDASAPSMFRCCYFQEFIHCVSLIRSIRDVRLLVNHTHVTNPD